MGELVHCQPLDRDLPFHHPTPLVTPSQCQRSRARLGELTHLRARDPERLELERFPDFLILGPQRTGTTWLYHNLKKHPQVFLPRQKETYYFSTLGRPEHAHYTFDYLDDFLTAHMTEGWRHRLKRHYDGLRNYGECYRPIVRGEATATNALLAPEIIAELVAIQPDLKAVLMLRDPIERAWSHARKDLVRKHGRRPEDVSVEDYARFFRASGQRGLASFVSLLQTWTAALKPGHLFVGDFEMIEASPRELLTGLQRFLGIRSGERYFNRHLEERINPAAADVVSRPSHMPDVARDYLMDLLAEEADQYRELRRLFQLGDIRPSLPGIGVISFPAAPTNFEGSCQDSSRAKPGDENV
ncbi:MAG: sulfotransferase domain-containing protein [Verrucomicrobiae bacterium]|nr:sulfotransferase domain-containing protein [Verrucomicrobiae bacterium]